MHRNTLDGLMMQVVWEVTGTMTFEHSDYITVSP